MRLFVPLDLKPRQAHTRQRSGLWLTWRVVFTLAAVPASAQSVISTHAGLIHFFQGAVFVNDHPLEAHLGKFTNVPQGAELRTEKGRAEVLLTPGVFLRVGENSAIRMSATELADTQVEMVSGSAMLEAGEPNKDTAVTVTYRNWKAGSRRRAFSESIPIRRGFGPCADRLRWRHRRQEGDPIKVNPAWTCP